MNKKNIYENIYFFFNDILLSIDKTHILIARNSFKIFSLILKNCNVFGEKKTNLGLFSIKSFLFVKFFCSGVDAYSLRIFFQNLKFSIL